MNILKDFLDKNYVLIQQKRPVRICSNQGRWNETLPGFYIDQPHYGLIDKATWNYIRIFQSINLVEENVEVQKMVLNEIHSDSLDGVHDYRVKIWRELQKASGMFKNTIFEFNLLVSVLSNEEEVWERRFALLGKDMWEEIEIRTIENC